MDKNTLALTLKARRKEKRLTLRQLGSLSGLHVGHIGHIEKGKSFPTGQTLVKLARPLGFTKIGLLKLAFLVDGPNLPLPPIMLTASEVAALLNVHINTVRRWSNQGILKVYRIGSRGDRRFKREDIDRFIQESRIGGEL